MLEAISHAITGVGFCLHSRRERESMSINGSAMGTSTLACPVVDAKIGLAKGLDLALSSRNYTSIDPSMRRATAADRLPFRCIDFPQPP